MERPETGAQVYYTTSYALGTGTTSTMALQIWRALSDTLTRFGRPMSQAELIAATGVEAERLDVIFSQDYYQKHYGFRRFESLEAWTAWAQESGVLYVPGKHDVVEGPGEDDLADETAEDETEEA